MKKWISHPGIETQLLSFIQSIMESVCTVFSKILKNNYLKYFFLYRFNVLVSKLIFKKIKKFYFNVFLRKKHFKPSRYHNLKQVHDLLIIIQKNHMFFFYL